VNNPAGPVTVPRPDDEVQVEKWVRLLLNRWALLAAGALIGALLGFAAAARTPGIYEATSTVLLNPPPDPAGVFTVPGMRAVVISQSIASQLVGELRATGRYEGSVQTFLGSLSMEQVLNTQLFRVTVRLDDPQLAATAATRASELAVEFMSRLWQEMTAERRAQLEQQMEQARRALVDVEQELAGSRGTSATAPPTLKSSERARSATELDIQRRVYIEMGARLAQARIELAGAPAPLRLIDAAAVPDVPLPRGRQRTVALGLLAGLVLAACFVIVREWRLPPASGARAAPE
jgi:uncharacterized protein involved in exopolysaccharide biosynthesis